MKLRFVNTIASRLRASPIFSSMLTVGSLTVLVGLASFGRELLVAGRFGVGPEVDAFLVAFLVPQFAVNVLASSFMSALMPTYVDVREKQSAKAADRLFASCLALGAIFLLFTTILLAVSSSLFLSVLGSGFAEQTQATGRTLFFLLLPTVGLLGLARIYAIAINASKRFALVAVAPISTPLCAGCAILFFAKAYGIYALAAGVTVGALVELSLLIGFMVAKGLPVLPRWTGSNPEIWRVLRQYAPMVVGAAVMGGTAMIDRAMATTLPAGSVAALGFGNKLVTFILAIGGTAVGTVLLPHFSHLVAKQQWQLVRKSLGFYALRIFLLSLIPTILICLASKWIIAAIFERGAFASDDTVVVARVQLFYCLQIPFYLIGTLFVRLVSALKSNEVLFQGAVLGLVANVILNVLFMRLWGVAGIALSTSVVYVLTLSYISFALKRMLDARLAP